VAFGDGVWSYRHLEAARVEVSTSFLVLDQRCHVSQFDSVYPEDGSRSLLGKETSEIARRHKSGGERTRTWHLWVYGRTELCFDP
jgi:hypothetical protein